MCSGTLGKGSDGRAGLFVALLRHEAPSSPSEVICSGVKTPTVSGGSRTPGRCFIRGGRIGVDLSTRKWEISSSAAGTASASRQTE